MIAYSKINIREDRIVTMKDDRVFLLTGVAGFLGNNIAKQFVDWKFSLEWFVAIAVFLGVATC